MTKRITSFFQVTKPFKNGTSTSTGGDITTAATKTAIPLKRPRESHDSTKCASTSTAGIDAKNLDVGGSSMTTENKRARVSNDCDEAQQLLKQLGVSDQADDTNATGPTVQWKIALRKHFDSKNFQTLSKFIAAERMKYTIHPPTQFIWSALNSCPLHKVKVVIVGQDPYHGPNQAHGLSFSVLPGCPIPPSLKNIYKELMDDPKISNFNALPRHGHLLRWVQQGVLLLNAVMTVREKEPNSHQNKGWEKVTDEIIRTVLMYHCRNSDQRRSDIPLKSSDAVLSDDATGTTTSALNGRGCVFLLWGKPATTKAMNVIESVMKDHNDTKQKSTHAIICTSHPSPLGARKTTTPFLGSQCFSRCNEELIAMGHDPIDWNV